MSVAVCRGPAVPAFQAPTWLRPAELYKPEVVVADDRPAQVDIWNAVQTGADNKVAAAKKTVSKPFVNPGVRRSMSQKSLQICTESLGCETGSGDFTASLDAVDMSRFFASPLPTAPVEAEESFWQHSAAQQAYSDEQSEVKDDLVAVNYHFSGGRRSPRRSFPPPLPSMSSRDGPCLKMCSRRQDGRLVVEAVVVRPRGYLQANRQGGRLCLSFIECSARGQSAPSNSTGATDASYFPIVEDKCEQDQEVAMEMEEEDEEEVEVVDRGTVVEVKVSSQPQAPAAAKVHRSTLVINKFVGSTPFTLDPPRGHADAPLSEPSSREETSHGAAPSPTLRRVPSSTTTLAAAVAVASTETGTPRTADDDEEDDDECGGQHSSAMAAADTKQQLLLFTSRRGDKHDLLQSVRRCRQLRQKPLFILEQYCIATS